MTEKDTNANSTKISETNIVKAADEESISEKSGKRMQKIQLNPKKKRLTDSAAKLFENIEEGEPNEEFEFDEKGGA
ncbi:MAG: hypothetical protein CM1200mP30_22910 [Pseudomonadota bacterium]|nr:MAG: hypothetical protein CM1200mP30_22910 [Pseudomonadota bacterium]